MGTRVSDPVEVKQKAVEMRLAGVPMKENIKKLNIKNKTQVQTCVRWLKAGDNIDSNNLLEAIHIFGKGPEYTSEFREAADREQLPEKTE